MLLVAELVGGRCVRAWWSGGAAELLASEPEAIVQRLAVRLVETHHLNRDTQLHAWRQQIVLLRTVLRDMPDTGVCCSNIRCSVWDDGSTLFC